MSWAVATSTFKCRRSCTVECLGLRSKTHSKLICLAFKEGLLFQQICSLYKPNHYHWIQATCILIISCCDFRPISLRIILCTVTTTDTTRCTLSSLHSILCFPKLRYQRHWCERLGNQNSAISIIHHITYDAVPLQAWSGPEGSRNLRLQHFMSTAQYGGINDSSYHLWSSPVTDLEWHRRFQDFKAPKFHDNGTGWWYKFIISPMKQSRYRPGVPQRVPGL
jgi:hypothetical protein